MPGQRTLCAAASEQRMPSGGQTPQRVSSLTRRPGTPCGSAACGQRGGKAAAPGQHASTHRPRTAAAEMECGPGMQHGMHAAMQGRAAMCRSAIMPHHTTPKQISVRSRAEDRLSLPRRPQQPRQDGARLHARSRQRGEVEWSRHPHARGCQLRMLQHGSASQSHRKPGAAPEWRSACHAGVEGREKPQRAHRKTDDGRQRRVI